jgi:hypothetical protein
MKFLLGLGARDHRSIHVRTHAFYNRGEQILERTAKGGEHVAKGRSMKKEKKKPKKEKK